jgi:hypothetical protein
MYFVDLPYRCTLRLVDAIFALQEVYMLKQSCHMTLEQNIRPTITLHQPKTPATTRSQEQLP